MKYLFEDKAEDKLSELFRYNLPETFKSIIEFSDGNGNLVRKAEELLKTGETVVVILDTIPANKSIRDIYIALRRLSRQNEYRLIVWNVICAEYYFIRRFGRDVRLKAFVKDTDFETVLRIRPYKESELIETEEDRAFTKTFEKFCKLYIKKNGGECIISPEANFFSDDCGCNTDCDNLALTDKSREYREAYGFEIADENVSGALWDTHRRLLKAANAAIREFNKAGYLNIKEYPEIKDNAIELKPSVGGIEI